MSTHLLDTVSRFIDRHDLLPNGGRVVVGVSGGVDSMVCASVLRRLGYDVHVLHVNHGLREEADADEALVRDWCAEQSPAVPLSVVSVDPESRAEAEGRSLQATARRLRYDALAHEANDVGAGAVATGHHRDDQVETLLLNLVRGSGPEGLAGMRASRPLSSGSSIALVRPLLDVSREAIEAYAGECDLPWRTDPTNRSLKYDRGVVRTEVLPLLEEHFPGARETISRSAALVREYVDQALRPALAERMHRAYEDCAAGGRLKLDVLTGEPPVWQKRMILDALSRTMPDASRRYDVAEKIRELIDRQAGRRVELGEGTVWRNRSALRFVPEGAVRPPVAPTELNWGESVDLPHGSLHVEVLSSRPDDLDPGSAFEMYADADRLGRDLVVRTWDDGDRIRPLGMAGTKKVSAILTEDRVPPHRRDEVLVVCTDDHVAWIVGHRMDRRVRVHAETERVAHLVLRGRENASEHCHS